MPDTSGLRAIRSLDYSILLCEDIEAMRRFYVEVMGFDIRNEIDGRWVEFQVGSSLLALRLRSRPYDGPPSPQGAASVQLAFRIPPPDIEATASQLTERGIALLEPMADQELFGHRTLFFSDPEHNIIEIYAEI